MIDLGQDGADGSESALAGSDGPEGNDLVGIGLALDAANDLPDIGAGWSLGEFVPDHLPRLPLLLNLAKRLKLRRLRQEACWPCRRG